MKNLPSVLVCASFMLSLVALIPALGSFMHESDQASLLVGAVELSRGVQSPFAADFYNYDKQWGCYWLLAALHRALPGTDLVALGNITAFALFWIAVGMRLLCARIHRLESAVAVSACLLAPTLWMHSPFLASAFVSAGWMLLAWVAWDRARGRSAGRLVAVFLLFLAVATRVDALLILPWFWWSVTPAVDWFRHARSRWAMVILASGLTAFLAGRMMYTGETVDIHAPFFHPKLFSAFTVFGLGAAALALAWLCVALSAAFLRQTKRGRRGTVFYLAGVIALLLPFAYYAPQFFSPRYWTPLLCSMLGGLATRRMILLLRLHRCPSRRSLLLGTIMVAAILPIFVGLHLPFPTRPGMVWSEPTLFPTPDGLQPMGAMWAHLRQFASDPDYVADHNQATWLAARQTTYVPDETGSIPVLDFSLRSYVQLAAALHGLTTRVVSSDSHDFYSDERDLTRIYHTPHRFETADRLAIASQLHVEPAGPRISGHVILHARVAGGPTAAWRQRLLLATVAGGNQLRFLEALHGQRTFTPPRRDEGKSILLYSTRPFSSQVEFAGKSQTIFLIATTNAGPLYHTLVPGRAWYGGKLKILTGDPSIAVTVHPDYMSTNRL